ncbi:MAG: (p)ppGpp synthetase [Lentisphaerae bacterium]|nr:(p)ppGpp synthetase [Lentisphaerota bacterium]
MEWIKPEYSKKQVNKAGDLLTPREEFKHYSGGKMPLVDAIKILFNWRAAHAFPMQIILDFLRKTSLRVDKKAIAVQRLKRISSILEKLKRENGMNLSRMEDIAGCRVVVENCDQVYDIYEKFKKSRTKHILYRERDYINNPKPSGYRSIHLIYKYNAGKKEYGGLPVEIQIRSQIQHSWATAVEVVGTFTKQALKASSGDKSWLEFFRLVSIEFAKLERNQPYSNAQYNSSFNEMSELYNQLDVEKRLHAFKVVAKKIASSKNDTYYLLKLNLTDRLVTVSKFQKKDLENATSQYDSEEQRYKDDSDIDLVLVSAKSVKDLKKAYPNYFLNTGEFSKNLKKVFKLYHS